MARGDGVTTTPRPRTRARTGDGGRAVAVARQSPAAGELLGDKEPPAPRERLGSRVREARDRVWELVEERPLTAGAVGLALGLLGGLVLPGSRRENELLGGPRDHLLDEARQRVRKTVARGKRVARTAVAVAKEDVEET